MPEKVGWTGARDMTPAMQAWIDRTVQALPDDTVVITGGCVGVDAYVARIASCRGLHVHTILPANRREVDPDWQRYCLTYQAMPPGTTYRERNMAIVNAADRMVAVPRYDEAHPRAIRSGTWMTIRLARATRKPLDIFVPDEGATTPER